MDNPENPLSLFNQKKLIQITCHRNTIAPNSLSRLSDSPFSRSTDIVMKPKRYAQTILLCQLTFFFNPNISSSFFVPECLWTSKQPARSHSRQTYIFNWFQHICEANVRARLQKLNHTHISYSVSCNDDVNFLLNYSKYNNKNLAPKQKNIQLKTQ